MELYMVGGAVRDGLLGLPTKDIDFSVIGPKSYASMQAQLEIMGFVVFEASPERFTLRAHFPYRGFEFAGQEFRKMTADFVLARKEYSYSDGRRPDLVELGTLEDDLNRRDFSVNALAMAQDGSIIDLHGGLEDLKWRSLVAVGSAKERFTEDALRAMRALRFSITKGFSLDDDIVSALDSRWLPPLVAKVARERRQDELDLMLRYDTLGTLDLLSTLSVQLREAIMGDFRLTTTTKKVKR